MRHIQPIELRRSFLTYMAIRAFLAYPAAGTSIMSESCPLVYDLGSNEA